MMRTLSVSIDWDMYEMADLGCRMHRESTTESVRCRKMKVLFQLGGPTNVVRLIMTRRKARLDT